SLVARVARGTARDVEDAARAAHGAFREWADRSPHDGADVMHAMERALREAIDELVDVERSETGKPAALAREERAASAEYFGFYAAAPRPRGGETFDVGSDRHVFTLHEPFGVVAVIT